MDLVKTTQRPLIVAALAAAAMALVVLPVRAQQPPSEEPLLVAASVDDDRPYIGQQVTYISKIYRRSDSPYTLDQYEPPGFRGFWNVRETEQDEYSETIDSTEYQVVELRTILFPSVVGTLEIGPGALIASASPSKAPIVVESVPVTVDVRPTPPDVPAGFTGAVGRFDISAEVDAASVRMNESVRLTVKVDGEGNIDALADPAWPEFRGWRAVESPATASSEVSDGRLVGSRTYEIVLTPETAGELAVPEISYAYFDPDLEEYVLTRTSSIVVTVAEIDGGPSAPLSAVSGSQDERDASEAKRIKPVPPSLRWSGGETTLSVAFWAAWGIPLIVIAGAAIWRRRREAWEAALVDSRRRNALPNAQAALERTAATGDDRAVASADAVLVYLTDRFGEPLTGLTREALGERLQDAGVPAELTQKIEDTLAAGEAARYTPEASSSTDDTIKRTSKLLTELDGAVQP